MSVSFSSEVREIAGCRVALRRGGEGGKLLYLRRASGAALVAVRAARAAGRRLRTRR